MIEKELNKRITFEPRHQTRTLQICDILLDGKSIGVERTSCRWMKDMIVQYWINGDIYNSVEEAKQKAEIHGGNYLEEPYSEGKYFLSFGDLGKAVDYYIHCEKQSKLTRR